MGKHFIFLKENCFVTICRHGKIPQLCNKSKNNITPYVPCVTAVSIVLKVTHSHGRGCGGFFFPIPSAVLHIASKAQNAGGNRLSTMSYTSRPFHVFSQTNTIIFSSNVKKPTDMTQHILSLKHQTVAKI